MSWLSNIINDINYILLPPLCFGCNTHLSVGEYLLCTNCRHNLPLTHYNFNQENAVDKIFYGRVPIAKAASFLFFTKTGIVKNLLHYLKYKNQEVLADFIGDWFGSQIAQDGSLQIDYVVPVPLHPKKLKKRGYNQVAKFGQQLATHLNCSYRDDILIKTQNTRTQTKKTRLARWMNKQDLYITHNNKPLPHKTFLLVDDVITTGATIEACATALLKFKGAKIYVATIAVVP